MYRISGILARIFPSKLSSNLRLFRFAFIAMLLVTLLSSVRDSKKYKKEYKATMRNDREHLLLKKFRAERNSYIAFSVLVQFMLLEKLMRKTLNDQNQKSAKEVTIKMNPEFHFSEQEANVKND